MIRVIAISDIHGQLPRLPESDIVLIAGDVCMGFEGFTANAMWLGEEFSEWLHQIPTKHVVGVAGNHDFPMQKYPEFAKALPWHYLEDDGIELFGFKIWGTPWQPVFGNWAFNASDSLQLEKFNLIPDDTDILVSHSPPRGIGDTVGPPPGQPQAGSYALFDATLRVEPALHVFGHIHAGRGIYTYDKHLRTQYANVACVNNNYEFVHTPMEFGLAGSMHGPTVIKTGTEEMYAPIDFKK